MTVACMGDPALAGDKIPLKRIMDDRSADKQKFQVMMPARQERAMPAMGEVERLSICAALAVNMGWFYSQLKQFP